MKKFQFKSYVTKDQVENVLEQAKFKTAGVVVFFVVSSLMYSYFYLLAKDTANILPTPEANKLALIMFIYAVASAIIAIAAYIIGMKVLKPRPEEIGSLQKQAKTIEVVEVTQIVKDSKYHRAQTILFSILLLIFVASTFILRAL